MKFAEVKINIENSDKLTDDDLEGVDIAEAVLALEELLPELPKDAKWRVTY